MNKSKRIVAVHDLCGVGNLSLSAVIPILTYMELDVCALPTALLSKNVDYEEFTYLDLTQEMAKIIQQWERNSEVFDAFYTGYLASPEQVKLVEQLLASFHREDNLVVVDPVLGDEGTLYSVFTQRWLWPCANL